MKYADRISSRVADTDVTSVEMLDIVGIASDADAEIARLQAQVDALAKELGQVIEWHKYESIPLRQQELASIQRTLAAAGH